MMRRDPDSESGYVAGADFVFREQEQVARQAAQRDEQIVPRPGYLVELSGEPIPLEPIEYRILKFLARKPYKAYSRRQIIEAVAASDTPLTEEELDQHIQSLRGKLGLFSDYVQSVPFIGYRFKA